MTIRMTITPREGISLTINTEDMEELIKELKTAGLTRVLPAQDES